jgi:hypothetical protein
MRGRFPLNIEDVVAAEGFDPRPMLPSIWLPNQENQQVPVRAPDDLVRLGRVKKELWV